MLRRLLTDDTMPTADRVIGTLILLYAQSLQRILALRTSDITNTGDEVTLTLPGGTVPVPAPFDTLLRTHLAERAQQVAPAANPDSDWLFPGRPRRTRHPTQRRPTTTPTPRHPQRPRPLPSTPRTRPPSPASAHRTLARLQHHHRGHGLHRSGSC